MHSRLARLMAHEQAALVILGTHAGWMGLTLGYGVYVEGSGKVMWPAVWPIVFLAAWVTSVLYHTHRTSRTLWQLSFLLLAFAYLSRVMAILVSAYAGIITINSDWMLALGTWSAFGAIIVFAWRRMVTPWRL